ncbi:MAG: baseplate J/gp47 family protein [Patescibacteria group bacterium]|nr:baseplate J/gp47 family protein [Patescibacteria group bacterium]MCL5432437.1 baseplate J/gp47 family protein [Patescibacteria group bacterium]
MDLGSVINRVGQTVSAGHPPPEKFLAVKLSSGSVVATVWSVTNGQVTIGKIGSAALAQDDWDHFLKTADQAVSTALAADVPVAKVVFAVPLDWVTDGKITAEHLADLRRLCKELDLTPVGFVVITEALENYYKEIEGAPLTAILVGLEGAKSTLTMFRAGKNLGTVPLAVKDPSAQGIIDAMEETLKNFTAAEVLPSRIILFDGGNDLEELGEKITAHPWSKGLPFLHFPKVEIASSELVVKAVAVAGGVQMGGQVTPATMEAASQEPSQPKASPPELEEVSALEAGFTSEETMDELAIIAPPPPTPEENLPQFKPRLNFGKITALLEKIKIPTLKIPKGSKKFPLLAAAGLAAVIIIFAAVVYFVPKVTVIVKVIPQPFREQLAVTVTTSGNSVSSTNSAVLAGSFLDVEEVGTRKGVASGQKLVGDPAKGSVTIYSVSSAKTFPKGTVLASSDGLKFTLDQDSAVASGDAVTAATATVTVTAADIGDKYNLPAGTKFTLGSTSSSQYLAKNDSAFSGGNSHQATVVTKEDQDRLMATLSAELTAKAQGDLQTKLAAGQSLLPNAITAQVVKKAFSADVDSEADTISLDLTMDFRGTVFSQADLIALFAQKYAMDIPTDYQLPADSAQISVKDAKTNKDGSSTLTIVVAANLLPQVDQQALLANLHTLPAGVAQVEVDTTPRLFAPLTAIHLPFKKDNLKVEIVSQ